MIIASVDIGQFLREDAWIWTLCQGRSGIATLSFFISTLITVCGPLRVTGYSFMNKSFKLNMFMHLLMYFFCPYSGCEQYLGFSHSEFVSSYGLLVACVHCILQIRVERLLCCSALCLWLMMQTLSTQCTLSDYSRQLLLKYF